MMKAVILCLGLGIASMCFGQVEFGVFAGPQATKASYTANSVKQPTTFKYGFQVGACMKVPFDNRLLFAPALFYSMKGYKVTYNQYLFPPDVTATDNNTTIHTVETAFLLQYDFSSHPSHAFFKTGPSLDFQLFGNEKFHTMGGGMVDRNMKWGFADYGHYSANFLFQLGYETGSGFMIFGQYTHGLSSINNADDGPSIKHRAFGISVGKYFNRKK